MKDVLKQVLSPEARWEKGVDHDPRSVKLMEALQKIDEKDYFDWNVGGDGDNGEELMYHMDIYFELLDKGLLGE